MGTIRSSRQICAPAWLTQASRCWRRGGDSNSREPCGSGTFRECSYQPLTHLSIFNQLHFAQNWQSQILHSLRARTVCSQRACDGQYAMGFASGEGQSWFYFLDMQALPRDLVGLYVVFLLFYKE